MAAGDYRSVVFWIGGAGQGFAYNVTHLKGAPGLADQAACDVLAGMLTAAFNGVGDWHNAISDQVTMQHVTLQELTDPPGAEFVSIIAQTGDASGNLMPPEISLVTSLHTAHPGRRGRGRIYNWGFSEACNAADGKCDVSCTDIVNTGWTDYAAALVLAGDFELAVYSRMDDETYAVASTTTGQEWDEQRRRRR